jgi:hypothetical protein
MKAFFRSFGLCLFVYCLAQNTYSLNAPPPPSQAPLQSPQSIANTMSLITTNYTCTSESAGKRYTVSFLKLEGASSTKDASNAVKEREGVTDAVCTPLEALLAESQKSDDKADLSDDNLIRATRDQFKIIEQQEVAPDNQRAFQGYTRSERQQRDVFVRSAGDMSSSSNKQKAGQVIVWTLSAAAVGILTGGTELVPVVISITAGLLVGGAAILIDSFPGAVATKGRAAGTFILINVDKYALKPVYSRIWSYALKPAAIKSGAALYWTLSLFCPEGIRVAQEYLTAKLGSQPGGEANPIKQD